MKATMGKRHKSKDIEEGIISSNILHKLSQRNYSKVHPPAQFLKCPVNIANVHWKDFKLYINYLDLKAQNPNCGTFKIEHTHRTYQRVIKNLINVGWASREDRNNVSLRAYQEVWRKLGLQRYKVNGISRYRYWKIHTDRFSPERRIHNKNNKEVKGYLKEIEIEIRKLMAKRKQVQIRYALKEEGKKRDRATFSAKSTSLLFGYKSASSGSKLRKKYFEVINNPHAKPYWNRVNGRYEEPTKEIAI